MIKMSIDQVSLNRTIRDLDKLSNKKHKEAIKIVRASAYTITSKAKTRHAFENQTGRLQSSIHPEWKGHTGHTYSSSEGSFDGSLKEEFKGNLGHNIGSNVDYAEHVHEGTSKMGADPFLSVPFYIEKPKMLERLKKLVNEKW